jgi:Ca-activated chloride channel homolog
MTDISFAVPWMLLALPLVVFAYFAWAAGQERSRRRAQGLTRGQPLRPRYLSAVLLSLAAGAAIVAAAQPQWGSEESRIRRDSSDVVFVIDVSRSMDARDVTPSRLEATRLHVGETLDRLGGDRVALVIFGGSARLRFPLTTDLGAAAEVVQSLEAGTALVEGGSNVAAGLLLALNAFDDEETGKLIVFVSDGENLSGDFAAAATRIRESGIDLLVAGAGTPQGATVPFYDRRTGSYIDLIGADGRPVISRLDENFLRALATASGGRYLGADPAVLPGAVSGRVAALERARLDERLTELPVDRFQWFAAAALLFVLLGTVAERLPAVSPRRLLLPATALIAVLFLSSCATEAYTLNEEARRALAEGDVERAVALFQEVRTERPGDADVALNLAAALDRAGRYEEAIQAARRVLVTNNVEQRARAHASIGHHQFGAGRLEASLDAFKQSLLLSPGNSDVRYNYEVVLRLLNPPPPDEPGDDPGQNGEPGDGEPGDGEPGDGEPGDGEPGDGEPGDGEPGDGEPQPGDGEPGDGDPGDAPASPGDIDARITAIDREIQSILRESDGQPDASEALRILDLLAERSRLAQQRAAIGRGGGPLDY